MKHKPNKLHTHLTEHATLLLLLKFLIDYCTCPPVSIRLKLVIRWTKSIVGWNGNAISRKILADKLVWKKRHNLLQTLIPVHFLLPFNGYSQNNMNISLLWSDEHLEMENVSFPLLVKIYWSGEGMQSIFCKTKHGQASQTHRVSLCTYFFYYQKVNKPAQTCHGMCPEKLYVVS